MAKIPDATALGERAIADGRRNYTPDRSAQILQGANEALGSIGNSMRRLAQQDDQFNYGRAKAHMASESSRLEKMFETDPDFTTFDSRYQEGMTAAREKASQMIRGGRSRAIFESESTLDIDRGSEVIRRQAHVQEGQWGRAKLDELLETNRRSALETKDPVARAVIEQATTDAIVGAVEKRYITPDVAQNARQSWSQAYGEGWVNVMPSEALQLKALKNPNGTPADRIDPSKRADMIERLEDKMRVQVDRREAKAQAAMNQYETLIASGLPSTPQMLTELRATVAGTTVAGQLDEAMADEKEVQGFMKKPIAEQRRLVQQKEAALMSSGGTMKEKVRDARNTTRLKQTFEKNIAEITTNPLLFAEKRFGEPNAPIDVTAIMEPTQQQQTAATLQERATTLRTLTKQLGAQVPMKPLLPQEAQQLGTLLEGASPQQAAAIFSGLHAATGTPEVFRGAMAQISADHPVMARAGNLSAMQRDLVTNKAFWWFNPDESVTSRDVAATLVRGDRILNPSKAEKGQDGSPQKKLLLPEDKELQAKFAKEVGTAFAGRDNELEAAYQVVKAYYAGRASETGRVAENAQDVDTKLVKEAVRATLGNAVDVNGAGKVLAPWGMSADEFEDRIEREFVQEAKRRGLPATTDFDSFGLVNAGGEGRYGVTLGNRIQFDEKGNPIVIDIRPPDARDQRGYIDRSAP